MGHTRGPDEPLAASQEPKPTINRPWAIQFVKPESSIITEEDREEMRRLVRQTLGLISRGAPDGAAEYARRAAELGKRVGRRWHREPKVPSERQGVLPFDRGWTWAGEVRGGQADRALQRAGHEA